jgi:lipoate-protein ligase A
MKTDRDLPPLPEPLRKNDALFLHGAAGPLPAVYTYLQERIEVVHGPSCKPAVEIRRSVCVRDNVTVAARRGGGGTVVLSPGTLVTVVVGRRGRDEGAREIFSRVHGPMIEVLGSLVGRAVEERGLSDLAVGGRKILGSSLYLAQRPALYFYQSSLMVHNDVSLLDRYLAHPPREPDYRGGRGHREFCTTLAELGVALGAEEVRTMVGRALRCAARAGLL